MTDQSKADKAIVEADNKGKTDLSDTGDAVIDDGKGSAPIKQDPFQSRKAIFNKASGNREQRLEREAEQHPDVANIRDAINGEAAVSTGNELDRGDHFNTNRTQVERREPAAKSEESLNEEGAAVDTGNGRVKVKVLGQEFEVPQGDVDAAGGLKAYQMERSASIRLQMAASQEADLKAAREKLEADRKAWEQQRASAGAPSTVAPASTQPGDAGKGADVAKQAEAIANDLYSGDPKRAQAAIRQVLEAAGGKQTDPEEVARQAAELLRKQDTAPAASPVQPVDAKTKVEVEELNAYMAENFGELMADDDLRTKAVAEFNRLKALPENRQRRWVDMGREAAKTVQKDGPHPRQDVIDKKRGLPPTSSGSTPHSPVESAPVSGSSWVERMRKARGLPTS